MLHRFLSIAWNLCFGGVPSAVESSSSSFPSFPSLSSLLSSPPSNEPSSNILFTEIKTKVRVGKSEGSLNNRSPIPSKILGQNKIAK